jgi:hypothetical protein
MDGFVDDGSRVACEDGPDSHSDRIGDLRGLVLVFGVRDLVRDCGIFICDYTSTRIDYIRSTLRAAMRRWGQLLVFSHPLRGGEKGRHITVTHMFKARAKRAPFTFLYFSPAPEPPPHAALRRAGAAMLYSHRTTRTVRNVFAPESSARWP